MILWFWSNNGDPEEPGSVTPSSQASIHQTAAPPVELVYGLSSSKQIFFTSPDGWWMPVALSGVSPEASQPAYSTSQLLGGVLLNSINATSAPPSATNSAPPEMLLLVGPVLPEQVLLSWLK